MLLSASIDGCCIVPRAIQFSVLNEVLNENTVVRWQGCWQALFYGVTNVSVSSFGPKLLSGLTLALMWSCCRFWVCVCVCVITSGNVPGKRRTRVREACSRSAQFKIYCSLYIYKFSQPVVFTEKSQKWYLLVFHFISLPLFSILINFKMSNVM